MTNQENVYPYYHLGAKQDVFLSNHDRSLRTLSLQGTVESCECGSKYDGFVSGLCDLLTQLSQS